MSWAPDYISSDDLKNYLRITDPQHTDDNEDDAQIAIAITAASRAIDNYTFRQFGSVDPAVMRTYRYEGTTWNPFVAAPRTYLVGDTIVVDDLMTTTDLVVIAKSATGDNTTLTEGIDFKFLPLNAPADGKPWTMIESAQGVSFPRRGGYVLITAKWGWTAIPGLVTQACLLQASRLMKRRDAPFGIAGSPEMGSEMRLLNALDPDLQVLLRPLRRHWGAV